MSSTYGILDAIAAETQTVAANTENIIREALEVVSGDEKILAIMNSDNLFREDMTGFAKLHNLPWPPASMQEMRIEHRDRLIAKLGSLKYARGSHEPVRNIMQDIRHLLSRISRSTASSTSRAKEIQDTLLQLSSRLHTAWDRVAERVEEINQAQGIKPIGARAEWTPDARSQFMPSDYCVSMLSQMWCAQQEIAMLEPLLDRAIFYGDIVRASELGGRVAGLKAALRLLATDRPAPEPLLALTWFQA